MDLSSHSPPPQHSPRRNLCADGVPTLSSVAESSPNLVLAAPAAGSPNKPPSRQLDDDLVPTPSLSRKRSADDGSNEEERPAKRTKAVALPSGPAVRTIRKLRKLKPISASKPKPAPTPTPLASLSNAKYTLEYAMKCVENFWSWKSSIFAFDKSKNYQPDDDDIMPQVPSGVSLLHGDLKVSFKTGDSSGEVRFFENIIKKLLEGKILHRRDRLDDRNDALVQFLGNELRKEMCLKPLDFRCMTYPNFSGFNGNHWTVLCDQIECLLKQKQAIIQSSQSMSNDVRAELRTKIPELRSVEKEAMELFAQFMVLSERREVLSAEVKRLQSKNFEHSLTTMSSIYCVNFLAMLDAAVMPWMKAEGDAMFLVHEGDSIFEDKSLPLQEYRERLGLRTVEDVCNLSDDQQQGALRALSRLHLESNLNFQALWEYPERRELVFGDKFPFIETVCDNEKNEHTPLMAERLVWYLDIPQDD